MRRMPLRTMIPARAIIPIMLVAVKKAPKIRCPGAIPTSVRGMAAIITRGVEKDPNQATMRT